MLNWKFWFRENFLLMSDRGRVCVELVKHSTLCELSDVLPWWSEWKIVKYKYFITVPQLSFQVSLLHFFFLKTFDLFNTNICAFYSLHFPIRLGSLVLMHLYPLFFKFCIIAHLPNVKTDFNLNGQDNNIKKSTLN